LDARVLGAKVTAALGDPAAGLTSLGEVLKESRKHGCVTCELDARLATGQIEMNSGRNAASRARLEALEKDAKAKGFLLIARKAAQAHG
jgi:hypothetical protein